MDWNTLREVTELFCTISASASVAYRYIYGCIFLKNLEDGSVLTLNCQLMLSIGLNYYFNFFGYGDRKSVV